MSHLRFRALRKDYRNKTGKTDWLNPLRARLKDCQIVVYDSLVEIINFIISIGYNLFPVK